MKTAVKIEIALLVIVLLVAVGMILASEGGLNLFREPEVALREPLPVPTEEELAYGKALQATMKLTKAEQAKPPFAEKVLDPAPPVAHGGSTDTADVSWNCPTVQMHIGTWVTGTPGHSWQVVSQGTSSYAHKALLYAGKAIAGTIFRLFENPELVKKAWEEHQAQTGGKYFCPIPYEIQPPIPEHIKKQNA